MSSFGVATTCPVGQYRCNKGNCLPRYKVCDKKRDCSEGEDEVSCGRSTKTAENFLSTVKSPCFSFGLVHHIELKAILEFS